MSEKQALYHVPGKTPEGALQTKIIELLTRAGWLVIRINSGGSGNRQACRWYAGEPKARTRGVFDLVAIKDGKTLFFDPKATRKPSPEQLDFQQEAAARGVACYFVRTLEEVAEVLG